MYEVLIGLDGDEERARAQAEAVADLPAADESVKAYLCHVFQDNPEGAAISQVAAVRRARDALDDRDVEWTYHEASGDPAHELLTAAADLDADLVCLSGRRRRPTGKAVFGSVTQDVILEATRPVLTVGTGE